MTKCQEEKLMAEEETLYSIYVMLYPCVITILHQYQYVSDVSEAARLNTTKSVLFGNNDV